MQMKLRNGDITIVAHDQLYLMAEVETGAAMPGWVTFGAIGSDSSILIDDSEWLAFKELVAEVDAVIQDANQQREHS